VKILIPSIQVPFISGGSVLMTNGLKDALIRHGHQVEVVTAPFKFFPESYIENLIDFWKKQDFENFNGHDIDMTISLQFPSYYAQHPNKVLWLMHQHRAVYELYNKTDVQKDLKKLKQTIHENDTKYLSSYKKRFSMSNNVTNRLKRFNNIDSTPLYHPPYGFENFYNESDYGYIFCPSRLETLKRQDLLIEAMQYTKTPLKAIIAGEGGQKHTYQSLVEKYNLKDKVRLIGHITDEEKYAYYARSLAVFFAPFDEDYGYITLEAMLSSKPVVTCSDSGGPLEFVIDGETGFITEADPKQIAEVLDKLYANKNKAKLLGENALQYYISKNISWDNVVDTLLS